IVVLDGQGQPGQQREDALDDGQDPHHGHPERPLGRGHAHLRLLVRRLPRPRLGTRLRYWPLRPWDRARRVHHGDRGRPLSEWYRETIQDPGRAGLFWMLIASAVTFGI